MFVQSIKSKQGTSYTHLSRGQKDGLRQHGLSEREFDNLSEEEKQEWIEELDIDSYETMRKFDKNYL